MMIHVGWANIYRGEKPVTKTDFSMMQSEQDAPSLHG